jgi:hypothetical protein
MPGPGERTTTIDDLPAEMVAEVLSRTGANATVCLFVCRLWRDLIRSHPCAADMSAGQRFTDAIAREGQLAVAMWARENGCLWDDSTYACAAGGGHLEFLKWLKRARCARARLRQNPMWAAARGGHIEAIRWLRGEGFPLSPLCCHEAAAGGHVEVLKWLVEEGCPLSAWCCAEAAGGGRIDALEWLRREGCPWNALACSYAAGGGHLGVLRWLRGGGVVRGIPAAAPKPRKEVTRTCSSGPGRRDAPGTRTPSRPRPASDK